MSSDISKELLDFFVKTVGHTTAYIAANISPLLHKMAADSPGDIVDVIFELDEHTRDMTYCDAIELCGTQKHVLKQLDP